MIRTSNSCCGNDAGLVEKFIGTAYDVVKTVYDNLGELGFIYDFLNKYGVLIAVSSTAELQALPVTAKYTRVYSTSNAGERIYTDYLYVEGDRTGVIPTDPTATGSWVVVGTSISGGGSSPSVGYIPFLYNQGSAVGGETEIVIPDGAVGVPFIIVNGYMNYVSKGFTFSPDESKVLFAQPLEAGDEVVVLMTGTPAVPDNPSINNWTVINWLYNHGNAVGGEQVITIPYMFEDIPAIFKNGLRYYKGLLTQSYTVDAANQRIILTEALATNDRLIVQIGGELVTLETSDRTLEEVARSANVKDSEVILSTDTATVLNNKTVLFDVTAQKTYGLPTLPNNVYISSVAGGQLTYNPGGVVVDLIPRPDVFINPVTLVNALRTDLSTPNSTQDVDSTNIQYKANLVDSVNRELNNKLKDYVSVKDFGAKCDGVTDDTDAFQAAIDSLPTGGTLHVPGGAWVVVNGLLEINTGDFTVQGDNTTLIKSSGTSSSFFKINNSNVTLTGLTLAGVGYATAGVNSYAIETTVLGDRVKIKDLRIREVWAGIKMASTIFTIENVEILHFKAIGTHVDQSGNTDGIGIFHNYITTPAPGVNPYAGIKLEHAVGIIVSDSEIMGCNSGIVCDPGAGKNVTSVRVDNTYLDSSDSAGFAIYAEGGYTQRIVISDSWLSGTYHGSGFRALDGAKIYGLAINNCEVNGNSDFGVVFGSNCDITNIDLSNLTCAGNGVADISFGDNSKFFSVNNCRVGVASSSYPASPAGLYIGPGSNNFTVTGGILGKFNDASFPTSGAIVDSVLGWGTKYQSVASQSLAAQTSYTYTITVDGARQGDIVGISYDAAIPNLLVFASVSSNNTVTVTVFNGTGASVNTPACGVRVKVSRYF